MAHAILHNEVKRRGLGLEVNSAGILDMGSRHASLDAQRACQRAGIPLPKLESRKISPLDLQWADVVLVMEPRHVREITENFAVKSAQHVQLLSRYDPLRRGEVIEDPVGCSPAEFERCFERLRVCLDRFLRGVAPPARPNAR